LGLSLFVFYIFYLFDNFKLSELWNDNSTDELKLTCTHEFRNNLKKYRLKNVDFWKK